MRTGKFSAAAPRSAIHEHLRRHKNNIKRQRHISKIPLKYLGKAVGHRDNRRGSQPGFCVQRKSQSKAQKPQGIKEHPIQYRFSHKQFLPAILKKGMPEAPPVSALASLLL